MAGHRRFGQRPWTKNPRKRCWAGDSARVNRGACHEQPLARRAAEGRRRSDGWRPHPPRSGVAQPLPAPSSPGRSLWHGSHLPRRRRGSYSQSGRRTRNEHRDSGCLESRLEARPRRPRDGSRPTARFLRGRTLAGRTSASPVHRSRLQPVHAGNLRQRTRRVVPASCGGAGTSSHPHLEAASCLSLSFRVAAGDSVPEQSRCHGRRAKATSGPEGWRSFPGRQDRT